MGKRVVPRFFKNNSRKNFGKYGDRMPGFETNSLPDKLVADMYAETQHKANMKKLPGLTPERVLDIRREFKAGKLQKDIAAKYGISKSFVCNIIKRRNYRSI